MKSLKRLISFIIIVIAITISDKVGIAAEIQYTDNVIPQMNNDTSPNGKASASNFLYEDGNYYSPWLAFDHNSSSSLSAWVSDVDNYGWLEYDFSELKCITKYTIVTRGSNNKAGRAPKNWTFEGWNEQSSEWVILDTQSNVKEWVVGVKREFTFINNNFYKKYRINVTATNDSTLHVAIGELEMMETVTSSAIKFPKVVLEPNEELQLSVDDDLDENTKLTWTSSDNAVASVDGNGVVKAIKPGNTVVTVTNDDGSYTDSINILVVEGAKDYRLAIDLKVGKSCRLTIDDATDTVPATWTSLDLTIATVSSKGKVTAVSEGLTIISVTDADGNEIGQIYIRVRS